MTPTVKVWMIPSEPQPERWTLWRRWRARRAERVIARRAGRWAS